MMRHVWNCGRIYLLHLAGFAGVLLIAHSFYSVLTRGDLLWAFMAAFFSNLAISELLLGIALGGPEKLAETNGSTLIRFFLVGVACGLLLVLAWMGWPHLPFGAGSSHWSFVLGIIVLNLVPIALYQWLGLLPARRAWRPIPTTAVPPSPGRSEVEATGPDPWWLDSLPEDLRRDVIRERFGSPASIDRWNKALKKGMADDGPESYPIGEPVVWLGPVPDVDRAIWGWSPARKQAVIWHWDQGADLRHLPLAEMLTRLGPSRPSAAAGHGS